MTLKVVRLGSETKNAPEAPRKAELDNKTEASKAARQTQVTPAVASSLANSEAAVVNAVRSVNKIAHQSSLEKIKDFKEAKEVAEDLSDRIKNEIEAEDAHSEVDPVAAKEHLVG